MFIFAAEDPAAPGVPLVSVSDWTKNEGFWLHVDGKLVFASVPFQNPTTAAIKALLKLHIRRSEEKEHSRLEAVSKLQRTGGRWTSGNRSRCGKLRLKRF